MNLSPSVARFIDLNDDLSLKVKAYALRAGADLVRICNSSMLKENSKQFQEIVKEHKSFLVVAVRHSSSALKSNNVRVKKYDTIYAYDQVRKVTQKIARMLEAEGFQAVAVPAFLPIDMADDKLGMVGDADLKKAGVLAGLGVYGRSGLLVTKRYGPRVRLGGVLTDALLKPDDGVLDFKKALEELCEGCFKCVEECPSKALKGDGNIDKARCGSNLFDYGLRGYVKFLENLSNLDRESRKKLTRSYAARELWQNFMTGNYYYCWKCQAICPK